MVAVLPTEFFLRGTPSSRNMYSIASILGISDSEEKRVPASEAREEDSFLRL